MANRAYLYATDVIPGGKSEAKPYGLSEYNWEIPLIYKLLIANAPRRVRSAIWKQDCGIIAERAGAFERVEKFARQLLKGKFSRKPELTRQLESMRKVLANTPPTRYLLLEVGEIVDMTGSQLTKAVDSVIAEIPALVEKVERAIAGKEGEWLEHLRTHRGDPFPFEFSWWSNVLYFSFGKPENAPPAGPAKATKQAPEAEKAAKKATKPAAKKATKPAAKKATKPAARKATRLAAEKAARSAAKKATKPAAKKVTRPMTKKATRPAVKKVTRPAAKQAPKAATTRTTAKKSTGKPRAKK